MKNITNKQLEKFLLKNLDIKDCQLYLNKYKNNWTVEIIRENEYFSFGYPEMKKIAEIMETDKISTSEFYKSDGCSTCDYGARYSVTFMIG